MIAKFAKVSYLYHNRLKITGSFYSHFQSVAYAFLLGGVELSRGSFQLVAKGKLSIVRIALAVLM